MRTENLQRAQLLMQQDRFSQAEGELRLHLATDPEDGVAHALLAVCLLRQEKLDPAEKSARQAIALTPAESFAHQILGAVLLERNRFEEAQQAVQEALTLNPVSADLYALKGAIALHRYRWQEALVAAETGLAFEPDNIECINIQAQALVKLGRKEEASRSIGGALERAPEDSYTHANQGWALLHRNQPRQALEHFREALRLDATNEFARAGMVEALKARNFIYRGMLSFFLWMSRLPPQVQFGVIIGGFLGMRVLRGLAATYPVLAPFIMPIVVLYLIFAVMTWIADPLFNLLLRIDRFGKHALSAEERTGSTIFGLTLATALLGAAGLLAGWLLDAPDILVLPALAAALIFGFALIPVSAIWKCERGWPRMMMGLYSMGLIALGLSAFVAGAMFGEDRLTTLLGMFFVGVFVSQFVANGLMMVRPRR